MKPIELPTLSHFKNGNGWLGSAGLLRYQVEKPAEGAVTVVLWQGPFSRPYAQELDRATFPCDEQGLADLAAYLDQKAGEMEAHSVFTSAETDAYYRQKKAEEQAPKEEGCPHAP